jgi:hypothetical protein
MAMAISRPFLLALLGAVLLGATFFAVQSARNSAGDDKAPAAQQVEPAQQAVEPAEPAPAALGPEEALQAALTPSGVRSTAFTATLLARGDGERASLELSGAYELGAANDLPEIELTVSAQGLERDQRFEGGFVSVDEAAYFTQGRRAWQLPDEVWGPLVDQAARNGFDPSRFSLPVDPQKWVRDAKAEGTETIDGVETTHVSATVDEERVAQDVLAALRASGQEIAGTPVAAVKRGVKSAQLDAWVGTEDRIVRRLAVESVIVDDGERGVLSLDVRLTGVNKAQDIEAPADVSQGMPAGWLGELADGFATSLSSRVGGAPLSLAALTSPNPRKAARAVADGKKVVILFQNPDGLDDRAMRRVMRELDARTRAVVLTDDVDAVDRYGSMVEDLGVSQTPAVVLIDRKGDARLIEGYVDTDTLAQAVADAR